jgi:glycosyltransferase involved in cell wall biosynthesis
MPKKVAVVSLHFSPAHGSHMIALAKLLRELGHEVSFVLDERYLEFANFSAVGKVLSAKAYAARKVYNGFDLAIFCNAAVNNHLVARDMRVQGIDVFYIFHEPDSVWKHLSEGWKEIIKLVIARYCSIAMLRQSSGVIVPSDCARGLYEKYFSRYNDNVHTMPLLFDDEISPNQAVTRVAEKQYFSFIGNAIKAHAFDSFIAFAKNSIRRGRTFPFAIATKVDLSMLLVKDKELARYVEERRIEIQHGRVLSNDEINDYYLKSFCVWNIYNCSTQSGVLPRAFMAGAAVIARENGSFPEFVRPGTTGEFIRSPEDHEEIFEHAEKIRKDTSRYAGECRKSFMETFFYRANRKQLAAILACTPEESLN